MKFTNFLKRKTDIFIDSMQYRLFDLGDFDDGIWSEPSSIKKIRLSLVEKSFLWGIIIPLAIIHLSLKIIRVNEYGMVDGFWGFVDLYKSDFILYLFLFFIGVTLLGALKHIWYRVIMLLTLQLFAVVFTLLEISAHNFYTITGSALDYNLVAYTIEKFAEVKDVMASESSHGSGVLVLTISILTVLILPAIISAVIYTYRRITNGSLKKLKIYTEYSSKQRLPYNALALLFFAMLFLPAFSDGDEMFSRNFTLNIVATMSDNVEANVADSSENWSPPVQTYLTKRGYSKKRNLVFIILESTRASATSLYSSKYNTTPFLKKLSKHSFVAKNYYTIIPRTSKSITSIHCGIEPRPSMRIKEAQKNGIPAKCLPELLGELGYETAYFQSATERFENRRKLVANFGFKEFFPGEVHNKKGYSYTNYFGYEDKVLLPGSLSWHRNRIRHKHNKPFMVTYLTNTPHHLYGLPRKFKRRHYSRNYLFNKYLNTIHYVDSFVKELFDQYKKLGIYRDTVFVIVADHGEGHWEHGLFGHSNTIYEEGMHIPMIIHDPKRFKRGYTLKRYAQHQDLLPTVVDLMGLQIKNGEYRGHNLLLPKKENKIHGNCWHENSCVTQYNGFIKYIHFFNKRRDEVYDLRLDPHERHNIAKSINNLDEWRHESVRWYNNIEAFYKNYQTNAHRIAGERIFKPAYL